MALTIFKEVKESVIKRAAKEFYKRGRALKENIDKLKEDSWVKALLQGMDEKQSADLIETYERMSQMYENEGKLAEQEKINKYLEELKKEAEILQIKKEQDNLYDLLNTLKEEINKKIRKLIKGDVSTKSIQSLKADIEKYNEKLSEYKKNDNKIAEIYKRKNENDYTNFDYNQKNIKIIYKQVAKKIKDLDDAEKKEELYHFLKLLSQLAPDKEKYNKKKKIKNKKLQLLSQNIIDRKQTLSPIIDLEPIDLEPIDLEPIDLEPIDLEPIDLEPIDLEPIDLEPTDQKESDEKVETLKKVKTLKNEIIKRLQNLFLTFSPTELNSLSDKLEELEKLVESKSEKEDFVIKEIWDKIWDNKYYENEEFLIIKELIYELEKIKEYSRNLITELQNYFKTNDNTELKKKYNEFINEVQYFCNGTIKTKSDYFPSSNSLVKLDNYGIEVNYDEETSILSINFKNLKIREFKTTLIKAEDLTYLNEALGIKQEQKVEPFVQPTSSQGASGATTSAGGNSGSQEPISQTVPTPAGNSGTTSSQGASGTTTSAGGNSGSQEPISQTVPTPAGNSGTTSSQGASGATTSAGGNSGSQEPISQTVPTPAGNSGTTSSQGASGTTTSTGENSKDIEEFKNDYILKLEELNDLIATLNRYNATLATKIIDFNSNDLDSFIDTEIKCKETNKIIMDLRMQLSNDRAEFRNKFKKMLYSYDEVKTFKEEKIKFSYNNYSDHINQIDECVINAEQKENDVIVKINATNDIEEKAKLEELLKKLSKYKEAQNSYVERIIIEESVHNDIDIVTFLKNRRQNLQNEREKFKKTNNDPQKVEIINIKNLNFNQEVKNQQVKDIHNALIAEGIDQITLSLLKNGIKIKYSQQLKEKLSKINAKIRLLNQNTGKKSDHIEVVDNSDEQEIVITEDIKNIDDYKLEIGRDEEKDFSVIYDYDLGQISRKR